MMPLITLYNHAKNWKLLMTGFQENFQTPNFGHLTPLNPRIKIFLKHGSTLKWYALLSSTIMQKIRNIQWPVSEKVSKNLNFWHLIPLNLQIKIFSNYCTHSNDVPYCPLPSCKKLETFNDWFPRKCQKTRIFNT